jgi:hypothetical protein
MKTTNNVQNAQNNNAKKNNVKNAPKTQVVTNNTKADCKKFTPALVYMDRVRTQKSKLQSISRKYRALIEIYENVLQGCKFADFLAYMKKRHNITDDSTPKRGWSDFYAIQFAEDYIKRAAKDIAHPAHASARVYLLNEKLIAQATAQAEKEISALTK